MKKRVLSLLMAIAICLSMLPSAALAEIPGTDTNEVQTEQQIPEEQKPEQQITEQQKPEQQITDEQKPDEQKPDEQKPDEQKPDEQKPDKQNPDEQNPDEQKPAKAPRKEPAAETHTGDHGGYTLPEGKTWQGVSSLPDKSGYYYLTGFVTIDSTWKPANGTVLCLNGYGISMTNNGPVIHVQPDVTFTLCDCNGSQNRYVHGITHGGNGKGAGVLVGKSAKIGEEATARTNTAVFNMYGGAIYNNYPWKASGENAASASGVLIGGGTFNMYGGKITENKLTEDGGLGGGVFVANQGSFLMSGGEISGNHATEGGGVFVGGSYGHHDLYAFGGGTFTMSGGKITGNSGTGGGVYVSSGSNTSFTVSGSAQITGNTGSNVYLGEYNGESNTINVKGTLDGTASIGVSVETANQVVATGISAENAERFTSDNSKYSLQYDSTSQTLTLVGHDNHPICGDVNCKEHTTISWTAVSDLTQITKAGYYYLTQDVKIKEPWSPANEVTLCLNGHSITLVDRDNSSVIEVRSGNFTLCDCSGSKGKITHGYKPDSSTKRPGIGVSVYSGTFTMYGGSITGNIASSSYGGGVFVGSNRTFTMNGGSITGNTVTGSGGGVYMASGAEFTMNGGEITGNTSSSYGGGVYVYNGAEFTMTGGSITDNAAGASNENKSYGGGVYVQNDAIKFTMTGGSITGNKAKYGGGVWTGASFTVSGNVNITGNVGINGNTASNVYPSLVQITIGREGLKQEAKIGVTRNTIDTGKFATIATGAKDSCTADNFTADAGEPFGIKVESTGTGVDVNLYNGLPHEHPICGKTCGHTDNKHTDIEWKPVSGLDAITKAGNYYLTQDVTSSTTWTCSSNVNLCLNGHSITMTGNDNAINVAQNATFTLCDCNGSNAGNGKIIISKERSGVKIEYNGTFFMYSGSIRGTGTGVDVSSGSSKFNMYGGAIEGNTWHGVSNSGTFNMYDGVIKGNDRCGVYNTRNTFNMYGGSITGNGLKDKESLGGVYVEGGTFTVSGDVTITGNTAKGKTTNVYLPDGKTIKVGGALGNDAQIGVTTAKELAEGSYLTIAKGIDKDSSKYTLTETDLNAFTSDSSYDKRLNGNSIIFTKGDLHIHALCGASCTHTGTHSEEVWKPLTYNAKTQTLYYGGTEVPKEVKGLGLETDDSYSVYYTKYTLPAGNYYLTDNITLTGGPATYEGEEVTSNGGEIYIEGYNVNVNLCLNGHTLSVTNANSAVISISGTQEFTMSDCKVGGMLRTADKGYSVVQAYGVRNHNRIGTFTMYGGTISGSGAQYGVWANSYGKINMFGGTITDNENGVSISSGTSFTIGGTVNITGNTKNVDLAQNATITIDKSLTQESHIGVCLRDKDIPTGTAKKQFATGATNSDLNYGTIFSCDNGSQYVVSKDGDSLSFGLHQHSWSYTANGATITAKCTAAGCPLKDKNGGSYTITAPDNLIYDGNGKAATVTGSIPGVTEPTITYKKGDTTLDFAPTDVGKYTASITLGEGENAKTASVEYSITAKEVTVTGITATDRSYEKDNRSVALTGGTLTGVISGDTVTIDLTKAKGMMINANVGTNKAVTVTGVALGGADKGNYKLKEQPTGVTVNIIRADASVSITGAPTEKTYGDADFTVTAANGVTETTGNNGKWTWTSSDSNILEITSGADTATPTIKVKKADTTGATLTVTYTTDTHYGSANATITVAPKTLTAADLTHSSPITKAYDGSDDAPTGLTVSVKSGSLVGTDTLTVTGTLKYNSANVNAANEITFTPTAITTGNYRLAATEVLTITGAKITAKDVKLIGGINATDRSYVKDNKTVDLTKGTLTFDGLVGSETLDVNIPATGTISDAKVGAYNVTYSGVTLADGTGEASNYKLVGPLPTVAVNISKATAPTPKNITVSQKHTVTTGEKAIGTVMPADAGTLTYTKGAESMTGSVTVTSWAVDSTGKVTFTLSGGAAGDTVTLPVIIKSTNYADATVNVVITLTSKDIPNVTARDIVVTYDGNPIPADKITGTADVAGTWEWKADTAVTDVSDSGTKTVVFKPADSVNYAEVEKTITVTITRATPTGEPKYTEITTGGKTLADAALMLAGGTISFDEGELEWIDEKGNKLSDETVVEANKSYTWRFTPANANYAPLTGTIVLYPASTGIVIYTPVNDAIFLSGANQIVAPGSAATFRINKNFGEFRSVAVDGVTLDKSNYRAWSGSTYVKLTPAYMKTLSAGTHTLAVYFTGATATTTFTISAGSSNPATGASDFAGVGAAVAMAAVSLLGAAAVLRRK